MYWIWSNRRASDAQARIGTVPEVIERGAFRFDDGIKLDRTPETVEIIRDDDSRGTLTDNLIAPGTRGLVWSSRLRRILAEIGVDNIDYYPCRIVGPGDGDVVRDYQIANVLGRVQCVVEAESDLEMHPDDPGVIEFINSLALDESRIGNLLMFRLQEHSQVIVVEDKVKVACEQAGITGVRFDAPSEFSM